MVSMMTAMMSHNSFPALILIVGTTYSVRSSGPLPLHYDYHDPLRMNKV